MAQRSKSKARVSAVQRAVLGAPSAPPGALFAPEARERAIDLDAEMFQFALAWPSCQRLIELGVDGCFVLELSAHHRIGQARVQLHSRGAFWEPEGPEARLLIACCESGERIDIAALRSGDPAAVALRTGIAWCLGPEMIEEAHCAGFADQRFVLPLVSDPLEWLRARGRALCVLDWSRALPALRGLGEHVTIECDAGTGEALRARLRHGGLPQVRERAPRQAAARRIPAPVDG